MSRNTSLTLGDHFADFVDQQVGCGRYGSASEVVRAGLRLLEAHEAQLAALRTALIAGEDSGVARPLDVEAFLKARRSRGPGSRG
jgi:antitoxin ParD1/3/4